MKKTIRILSLMLAILMLGGTVALAVEPAVEDDIPPADVLAEVYNPEHYEHAFEPGQIGVNLKKSVTITEGYEALFPELNIVSVRRIGAMAYDVGGQERQILLIYLAENTRESVLNAIELLKSNPYVYYSKPNYQFEIADPDPHHVIVRVEEPEPFVRGDVTYDGEVDNRDLIMIARWLVGLVHFDEDRILRANFNGDNEINNADLIAIARKTVGMA